MKKTLTLLAATALTLSACSTSGQTPAAGSGCSDPLPDRQATAVVLGSHANSPAPTVELLDCYMSAALTDGHRVVVIVNDGQPEAVMDLSITISPRPQSGVKDRNSARTELEQAFSTTADDEENNPLEAIAQAARSLSTTEGPRLVLVVDSMLQTTGALPMQDGMIGMDSQDAVEYLTSTGQMPELAGTTVVILGLGATSQPQQPLDSRTTRQLEELWRTILAAAGAEVVIDVRMPTADPQPGLPPVTPVVVESPEPPIIQGECRVRLEEATIGFLPNSAEFLSPEAARGAIDQVADELRACPSDIVVTGTTSSAGTERGRRIVATARATAVAEELAQRLGISVEDIDIRGVGTNFPEFVPDRDAAGQLMPAQARENRSVIITAG